MAIGEISFPEMHVIKGVRLGTSNAGIKQTVRDDTLLIDMDENGCCAAVFTQNAFCAAPVQVAKSHLCQGPRWLLVNSGNANAGTGKQACLERLSARILERAVRMHVGSPRWPLGLARIASQQS